MTNHTEAPRPVLDEEAIRNHLTNALTSRTPLDVRTAVADIPVLLAEIERIRRILTWTRLDYANLLAAARASLAAHTDGDDDPLYYLRDEVTAQQDSLITAGKQ